MIERVIPKLSDSFSQQSQLVGHTKLGKFLVFIDPFIFAFIVVNSIMLGIATLDVIDKNEARKNAFEMCDHIFLIIFTVEICLSSISYLRLDRMVLDRDKEEGEGSEKTIQLFQFHIPAMTQQEAKFRNINRPWLIFDLSIVLLSWLFSQGTVVRSFRILRAIRLINKVQSLKNLTRALIHVTPKMGALWFITLFFLVIIGTACSLTLGDTYERGYTTYNYFGRIDFSVLTLFQMMTFDNWHEPVREIMELYPYAWIIFVLWIFFSGFVIMNLIIAVICESLVKVDEMGKQALRRQAILKDFNIGDLSISSEDDVYKNVMKQRLDQLEKVLKQLLDEELYILEELKALQEKKYLKSPSTPDISYAELDTFMTPLNKEEMMLLGDENECVSH